MKYKKLNLQLPSVFSNQYLRAKAVEHNREVFTMPFQGL